MKTYEVNFDGLVGPTHNYSGLSYGNFASMINQQAESNPRAAALQGLEKMYFLYKMGIKQAVLPPQSRPFIPALKQLGFTGTDSEIIEKSSREAPQIFLACCSAATMWVANAATVCPSADSADGRVHFTPANLSSKFHRSIEADITTRILKEIFTNPKYFEVHNPLPQGEYFADEGAANHTRFCKEYGEQGLQLFVYGRHSFQENIFLPTRFPARQKSEASQAIAKRHLINEKMIVYVQQNPKAIDLGVFHNDVISVGNQSFFFYHENAFVETDSVIATLKDKYKEICEGDLSLLRVPESEVSFEDAVSSYLFNSQIVTKPDGTMVMIAPTECQEVESVRKFLAKQTVFSESPIKEIHYLNLNESMRNGGGPACLRLRVVLTEKEIAESNPKVYLNEELYRQLKEWVNRHYRERLTVEDLNDPGLYWESQEALKELSIILGIKSIIA